MSPTSVCCDRLHITPPTLHTPFFLSLRMVVSGWRREGGQLRLTMARCACRPSCGDMSCHTSCPASSNEGQPNLLREMERRVWFVSRNMHLSFPRSLALPLPQSKKPKTQASSPGRCHLSSVSRASTATTHARSVECTQRKRQGCRSAPKARVMSSAVLLPNSTAGELSACRASG